MSSKWNDWILSQSDEVKQEILAGQEATDNFIDFNNKPITLKELEELDSKYNL